jgi:hypothetical protein
VVGRSLTWVGVGGFSPGVVRVGVLFVLSSLRTHITPTRIDTGLLLTLNMYIYGIILYNNISKTLILKDIFQIYGY